MHSWSPWLGREFHDLSTSFISNYRLEGFYQIWMLPSNFPLCSYVHGRWQRIWSSNLLYLDHYFTTSSFLIFSRVKKGQIFQQKVYFMSSVILISLPWSHFSSLIFWNGENSCWNYITSLLNTMCHLHISWIWGPESLVLWSVHSLNHK